MALYQPTVRPVNLKRCRGGGFHDEAAWPRGAGHPAAYGADDVHR